MKRLLIFIVLPILFFTCSHSDNKYNKKSNFIVRIETSFGNIDIMLFNETPHHRDNFINLVNKGFYDDLLFHRVINNFMIQGGDPESKNSNQGFQLGSGGPGYTIPAEIHDHLFHKKGALASARLGDNINPARESSGSQFYVVHGTVFSENQLNDIESRINNQHKQLFYSQLFREIEKEYIDKNIEPDYAEIGHTANKAITEHFNLSTNLFKFSNNQRELYTTIGGSPHLDGSYTVFGETINGFDVIDKIASLQTDNASRPVTDVKMKILIISKNQ